jgi:TM2 domain-containing membrane protein YozV
MPMFCPNCGAQNADTAKFCEKCGTALTAAPPPPPPGDTRVRGVEPTVSHSGQVVAGKNPALALVLSLVLPGLAIGQFYNGDIKKGALMVVLAIIGAVATGGFLTLGIWIWSMIDAYQVANGKAKIW